MNEAASAGSADEELDRTGITGRRWNGAGLSGRAFGPLPPEVEAALPRWFAGDLSGGVALKPPDVHRVGELVVKRFAAPTVFGLVRAPRAVRSARRHFWCLPTPSPRPLIALWRGPGSPSVLVREFVAGRLLADVPAGETEAERALAPFLRQLVSGRVLHGDLHPRNLLWTGERWLLLDVDGVRHGLHSRRRLLVDMWARLLLHLGDGSRVHALYRACMEPLGETARAPWTEVERAAARMRANRSHALPRPEPSG